MSTAAPLLTHRPSRPPPDVVATEHARRSPRLAAELGVTVDGLAALTATAVGLDEAEQLGWIPPEERRLYQGTASAADLRALGYGEDEAQEILVEQGQDQDQDQDQACASSS